VLDLSDNDLKDSHGSYICEFLRVQKERRDYEQWELSLRMETV